MTSRVLITHRSSLDMTLAILLLGLIAATCVIAYLADNLGKNLGKKRISLLGLRPRQTATLISMASSVGVMLLTVVILLLTSKSLSNALLRYDAEKAAANREKRRAEELARAVQTQILSKQRLVAQSEKELSRLQDRLRRTSTQLDKTRELFEAAEREKAAAARGAAAARRGQRQAQARAQSALASYRAAQRSFGVLRAQLASAQQQFRAAQASVRASQGQVAAANAQLAKVRNTLGASRANLERARAQLEEARRRREEASTQLAEAQSRLREVESNFSRVENQVKATLAQYEETVSQLEVLNKQRSELQAALVLARQQIAIAREIVTGNIEVPFGTVFAAGTVSPRATAEDTTRTLRDLLARGRESLGASRKTLVLASLPVATSSGPAEMSEDELISRLAEYLATLDGLASVRLVAARDHAPGEREIYARFLTVRVQTIFAAGEELAAATIDGAAGDARIFNRLLALLDEGEKLARRQGAAPLLGEDNPYFYAAGTNERIFAALRQAQSIGGKARVRLVAAQDISTVEPLRVRFEISAE